MPDVGEDLHVVHRQRPGMGTWFEAWLVGADADHLADVAEAVLDEVGRLEARLSRFDPRSEIARINRDAARGAVLVDREVFALLQTCRRAWLDTGGAFDVTATSPTGAEPIGFPRGPNERGLAPESSRVSVPFLFEPPNGASEFLGATGSSANPCDGPVATAHGFADEPVAPGSSPRSRPISINPSTLSEGGDASARANADERPTFGHVVLDDDRRTVRFEHPDLRLDLGGLGKGYALDRAREVLATHGVTRALLHGGTSSVLALGTDALGHPWPVGIRDLWAVREDAEAGRLTLRDRALSCSTALAPGRKKSDIIDPRTGRPLIQQDGCVVTSPWAVVAEILSTALVSLGRTAATTFLRSRDGYGMAVAWIEPPGDWPRLTWLRRDDPDSIRETRP